MRILHRTECELPLKRHYGHFHQNIISSPILLIHYHKKKSNIKQANHVKGIRVQYKKYVCCLTKQFNILTLKFVTKAISHEIKPMVARDTIKKFVFCL